MAGTSGLLARVIALRGELLMLLPRETLLKLLRVLGWRENVEPVVVLRGPEKIEPVVERLYTDDEVVVWLWLCIRGLWLLIFVEWPRIWGSWIIGAGSRSSWLTVTGKR